MDLSIIIVNFNTKDFLKKAIESVFRDLENSKLKFEVIVVDNGSTDGSQKYLRHIEREWYRNIEKSKSLNLYSSKCLNFKLIENKKNLGFAKANNQGIKIAKGRYILLLNPDTIVSKGTLPFMIKFMENNQKVGIATCRVELPSGQIDDACHRGFPTPWNAFCHFSGLAKLFPKTEFFNGYHLGYQKMDQIHQIDACVGAFMLIRRQAGEEVDWLDEDYFWYGEDLDFCFRVKKAGWQVMFVPDVKIIHYKGIASGIKNHTQQISTADKKTQKLAQKVRFEAMELFYKKHYQDEYPALVGWLVTKGIRFLSFFYAYWD